MVRLSQVGECINLLCFKNNQSIHVHQCSAHKIWILEFTSTVSLQTNSKSNMSHNIMDDTPER